MAEKEKMERLSAYLGEQGQDALQMMERMERLKRLMGTAKQPESVPVPQEEVFCRSRREEMLSAAIPFLDLEYQKDLYVVVRLMEMGRVLHSDALEARGKEMGSPALRRRKLLGAVQPYLSASEQRGMQSLLRLMDMKEIMEWEGKA